MNYKSHLFAHKLLLTLHTPAMSSAENPSRSLSTFSSTAEIRVLYPRRRSHSNFKSAHVVVSSRIYWKRAKNNATNQPKSLVDFRHSNSLELVRLGEGSSEDVNEIVKVDKFDEKMCITVHGRLHGHKRRNKPFVCDVRLEIIPNTPEQHEIWMNKIRARIAPWNLLLQELRDAAIRAPPSTADGLASSMVGTEPFSMPSDKEEEKWRNNLNTLPKQMEKLSIVDKLTASVATAVGSGATFAKLMASAECVTETTEFLADLSTGVAGVSATFQLVSLSAKGVSMCVEASRGQRVLPIALGQITVLMRYILEILAKIMKHSRIVNVTAIEHVFDALKETVCVMDMAETQLLRGRGAQIVNAEDVKKVEKKIEELRHMAVIADNTLGIAENTLRITENTSRICAVDEKVNLIGEGREVRSDSPHHVRPSVSAFFSGRKKELKTLKDILGKWGCAVITQYGGMGKTELMIAFADRVERDEQVPGGVFWVTVDGDERNVIGLLAELAEKLTSRKMSEDERRNANLVITALKQGLSERQGRWLLCLDNADDSKVRGILNELCGIADPSSGNGWVVVTSRQGHPRVWAEMKSDQKLVLEPLCVEDAMVALWRRSQVIKTVDAEDDRVMKEIEKLKGDDEDEYRALKELCGDEGVYSLGGLPLALVQAGTYIDWFECSFGEYMNMFKTASRKEEFQDIMKKTEEMKPIQDWQRSIWTTWKISVQQLSAKAKMVLQAMAMLGQGGIGEATVNGILEATTADGGGSVERVFRKVIVEELMHGSSLIWCDEGGVEGGGRRMYRMHRLMQLFILSDVGRGTKMWNDAHSLALLAIYQDVETELRKKGNSFYELPDIFEGNHVKLAAHTLALVRHYVHSARGSEIQNVSEVEGIHRYTGRVMKFMGKSDEEVEVWEDLLAILRQKQAENRSRNFIERLKDVRYRRKPRKEVKLRIADTYHYLGTALIGTGKLERAASLLEQSLQMERAIHGHRKPHLAIASSLNNLGLVYQKMGELEKALEKHEQSWKMNRAIYNHRGPDPEIALSLNNLGLVFQEMGELDEALEKHKQSLEMKRAIHGNSEQHPDIASSLNNLGLVYREIGELENALDKHKQCLEMYRAIHGPCKPHSTIAMALNNLGLVYQEMGELEKALEMLEQSWEMKRAIHGHHKPHLAIASSLNNLGLVYQEMSELDKSLEMHEQSWKMKQAIHGHHKPHPDIASSLNNLGLVYREMNELEKALEKHEQCLAMYRAIHGHHKPHYSIASSLNNIGLVYREMGELDKALEMHKESLELKIAIYGDNVPHPSTARSLWAIGLVYHKQKKLDHAAKFLGQSLAILRIVHGENSLHPHITTVQRELADIYECQGIKYVGCIAG